MDITQTEHNGLPRWVLRTVWVFIVFLVVGILLRLSLKTAFVQNRFKNLIVSTANGQLNAELSVERLTGDLWKEAKISGIRLMQEDTVARVDSVYAAYNIWALLRGDIEISSLGIHRPRVKLRQKGERWNVQSLVPESSTTSTNGAISLSIEKLALDEGYISVETDSVPLESSFSIHDLMISSSLAYNEGVFDMNLGDLSFAVRNTRLNSPLEFQASASAQNERITLEKLLLATGNSMVRSSGYVSPVDSSINLDFMTAPLSWEDIIVYVRGFPLRRDIKMDLSLRGHPDQFQLALSMEAKGLESFKAGSRFQWKSGLVLQQAYAKADYINLRELLSDTALPSLKDPSIEFSGSVEMYNYRKGRGNLKFSAKEVIHLPYHMDAIEGKGWVDGRSAKLELIARQDRQKIDAKIEVGQVWSDVPIVKGAIDAAHIDPSYWVQDSGYGGDLSLRAEFSGRGWYPKDIPWQYSIKMNKGRFMGQPIAGLSAEGRVSGGKGDVEAQLKIREGVVNISAELQDMTADPAYSYDIRTRDLDLGALMGREDFKTALNSEITGEGRRFDLASMELNTSITVDSSLVNDELVQNLSAEFTIRDTIIAVDKAQLQSMMAEGSFSLRLNMFRLFDPGNTLEFDLHVKDPGALAPLAGSKKLHAEGTVLGQLTPMENENLRFLGTIDLSNLRYNELFASDVARGSLELNVREDIIYLADLDLRAPTFSGVPLQDLALITKGNYTDARTRGKFDFKFSSATEGRIEQSGSYILSADSLGIRTSEFNIISDYSTLTLEKPFELVYRDDTLRMEPMRVSSGGGAFLEIGIPVAGVGNQRAFIRGHMLNMSVIQSCLLGETYIDGLLSGRFRISRVDTSLRADGELLLSEILYQGSAFDSLLVKGEIEGERLKGVLSVKHNGRELVTGNTDLPFRLGDPETFPSSFFDEPVSGEIRIREIAVEQFDSLLAKIGIEQTRGIFSLKGGLKGRAGKPEFRAQANLENAWLSGVYVDSVTVGANYRHEDADLELDASVMSLRQKAAQIDARLPLFIDMKTFEVDLPQPEDSIAVAVKTNNFNLRALNDFVDGRMLREVDGQLDGVVQAKGAMKNLKTDGKMELKNGAFRLVPAGIKIDHIRSTVNFDPNKVRLTDFSAKSGNGDLQASGMISLERLIPEDVNINVRAQNFRAANTSQYNAVINLDAKAKGSLTQPEITGSLNFISGFLKLQNFGEKSVESIQLDSLEGDGPDISMYDSLALDMDVTFNRRFFIRNQRYLEMEIELDGELDMLKERGNDLQVFGTINTTSGYARPFGKNFELERGSVTFNGQPVNPQLAVRTRYEPLQTQEDVVIWYIIEGTVEDPLFKYESQPPMELENIISYTLFGQPFYALDSWKQVVASSGSNTTAADVALDVLLDRVEALATQKLGIDVVKIDNSRMGGEPGTSITTGWYLNPKVFFAIQNVVTGSTPDTGFLLEYMLRENLKLIIRQGNGIRQGVDLKWNYDY